MGGTVKGKNIPGLNSTLLVKVSNILDKGFRVNVQSTGTHNPMLGFMHGIFVFSTL